MLDNILQNRTALKLTMLVITLFFISTSLLYAQNKNYNLDNQQNMANPNATPNQNNNGVADSGSYEQSDIFNEAQVFFGSVTTNMAKVIEYAFNKQGKPKAYILGEEIAGSFIGGLRYGKGGIHFTSGEKYKIFWQGPSIGYDFGGHSSKVIILIYNIQHMDQIFDRYTGVEGTAYLLPGAGINFQSNNKGINIGIVRSGVGIKLGVNIGYTKFTNEPSLNPF